MAESMALTEVLQLTGFIATLWLGGGLANRLRCPALIGELLAGMALGPNGAALLSPAMAASLVVAGKCGLLLMVCEGGLSMELGVLRSQGLRATVLALTGTALPVLLGAAFMLALGFDAVASIASGTALSSTAIGFTLRLMADLRVLETAQGQLITAAAMLDDVFSLVLLATLQALVAQGGGGTTGGALPGSMPALPPPPPPPPQLELGWAIARPLLGSAGAFIASSAIGAALVRAYATQIWPTASDASKRTARALTSVAGLKACT